MARNSKGLNILIVVLIIIMLIEAALIIFRDRLSPYLDTSLEKQFRDSIAVMEKYRESSILREQSFQRKFDSLSNLETGVIYRRNDKIKFIYTNATPDELDNIIRSNWDTKRHH